jgi:hypothetical protein
MISAVRNLALAIVAFLGASLLSGCGINTIPTYEEQAKAAWSEVLNQYQRRSDLIPNLVETVKGYAAHEKDVLTAVVEARAKATQVTVPTDALTNPELMKQFQENQNALGGALARLLAVVENYPDLKANQNFLAHRRCPPRLYRGGPALQHRAENLPRPDLGQHPLFGRQAHGDIRHTGRTAAGAEGPVQLTGLL